MSGWWTERETCAATVEEEVPFAARVVLVVSEARCDCDVVVSGQREEPLSAAQASVMGVLVATRGPLGVGILPALGGIDRCSPLSSNASQVDV